jgi:hypothetical protein
MILWYSGACPASAKRGCTSLAFLEFSGSPPARMLCSDRETERSLAMKMKALLLLFVFSTLISFSARSATVITFDDLLLNTPTASFISDGYQGLVWSNFVAENAILYTAHHGLTGYYYGLVSGSNNAFDAFGDPAEIDSPGSNFNFLSVYLTGAWESNLNIEVQGYRDTNLIYDETLVVSATNPTLFTFNYLDIDRLYCNSFGGETAFGGNTADNFVMDNFDFEFVPEPSSFLLAALGAVSLVALVRRKRLAALHQEVNLS